MRKLGIRKRKVETRNTQSGVYRESQELIISPKTNI